VGRHDGCGMTVAAMVGGCVVYLLLPTYIVCHVFAAKKILSMQSPGFCFCRQRKNLKPGTKTFASCIVAKETRSKNKHD
jgi:hypothetical protein